MVVVLVLLVLVLISITITTISIIVVVRRVEDLPDGIPNRPSEYVWVCHVCPNPSPTSGSKLTPWWEFLSLPDYPRDMVVDHIRQQKNGLSIWPRVSWCTMR